MKNCEPLLSSGFAAPTVILANGVYPEGLAREILDSCPFVVCCDGAADRFVEKGGVPAAIVGDCDSLSEECRVRFADTIHADPDQECNDLTKAVNFCVRHSRTDIVIVGATGEREDHTVGNISLLCDYMDVARVRMVTEHGVFTPICGTTCFESFEGQQVSVFSLDPGAEVTTIGLLYPLRRAHLRSWWQGTLNQSLGDVFGFTVTGRAVVFQVF